MFHSEILSPYSFLTFWNGLPRIGRQLCIKMWFWYFSTHKIYVTVRGKFSEQHFVASFFSNPREKVWKARKTLSHIFPCFLNLLPGIGKQQNIWEFCTHDDIYFVCGKLSELHFDTQLSPNRGRLYLYYDEKRGNTVKYSLSPREIPRGEPKGFPEGSGYISPYIPTLVIIQTFSISTSYISSIVLPGRAIL